MPDRTLLPIIASIVAGVFFIFSYINIWSPPITFPLNQRVTIEEGMSIQEAGLLLKREGFIRSPLLFDLLTRVSSKNGVIAGFYFFDKPANIFAVMKAITTIEPYHRAIRVTFTEGMTIYDMAKTCQEALTLCEEVEFIEIAKDKEGYLFPDTYFFAAASEASDVVETLLKTHQQKIKEYQEKIEESGHTLHEIITMASILEREAYTEESRKMVAGILWKRIEIGMPLQVDAAFNYVNGKNTFQLTTKDLATDSPYNTYTNKGLPPGPIANPSILSIESALNPTASNYLFYLTGRDGNFYYAKTHDEHVKNKARYLK